MSGKGKVAFVAFLLLVGSVGPWFWVEGKERVPAQLPDALSEYYQDWRGKHWLSLISCLAGPPCLPPSMPARTFECIVLHDLGAQPMDSSKMARDYLVKVIEPLKENKSIQLQDGTTIRFDQLDRLALAELIYYYVRDGILYPHPENAAGVGGALRSLPWLGLFVASLPWLVKFPVETVATGYGECFDQALLLATLLKIEGYDVAVGFFTPFAKPLDDRWAWWGYHCYVLVRDEGWGIGHWSPEKDVFGNPMPGKWIILDPINSPRHAPHMQMIGGGKPLSFGEDPPWTDYVYERFLLRSPWNWVLLTDDNPEVSCS